MEPPLEQRGTGMLPPIAEQVKPGTVERAALVVEDPEAGQPIRIPLLLARGAVDGPVLCLFGAQRGTDISGSAAIHLLFRHFDPAEATGLVIGAPLANPPATRTKRPAFPTADGWSACCPHDMDNAWPGDAEGALVERMTAALWDQCIEPAHAVVDFHAGAPQCGPLTTVRASSDASVAAAKAFGIAHIRLTREIDQAALYDVAARQGKAALRVSLPPPGTVSPDAVRMALTGVRNVLTHLHMSERGVSPSETALIPEGGENRQWHAPTDAILLSHVDPGSIVQEGAVVAELISLYTGEVAAEVIAPFRGVVSLLGCSTDPHRAPASDIVTQGELYAQMDRCDL